MSLYQPSYMKPRNEAIDKYADEGMNFSCVLNGNSALVGYNIQFFNAETSEIYLDYMTNAGKNLLYDDYTTSIRDLNNATTAYENVQTKKTNYQNNVGYADFMAVFPGDRQQARYNLYEAQYALQQFFAGDDSMYLTFITNFMAFSPIAFDGATVAKDFTEAVEMNYYVLLAIDVNFYRKAENSWTASNTYSRLMTNYITAYNNSSNKIAYIRNNGTRMLKTMEDFYSNVFNSLDYTTFWVKVGAVIEKDLEERKDTYDKAKERKEDLGYKYSNWDSGMLKLETPMYPVDYLGNHNTLVHNIYKNASTRTYFPSDQDYTWRVTLYWAKDPTIDPSSITSQSQCDSITSVEAFFKIRETPTVHIQGLPLGKLTERSLWLTGYYSQEENVPVNYFRWILKQKGTGEVLKDTGMIPSPDIRFYYDGFKSEESYTIQLIVQTQDGVLVKTDEQTIECKYQAQNIQNVVVATNEPEEHGIIVEWGGLHSATGGLEGTIESSKICVDLVIDVSGSMSWYDRMRKVKAAAISMVDQLFADFNHMAMGIITFNGSASTLLGLCTDPDTVKDAINSMSDYPSGGTNPVPALEDAMNTVIYSEYTNRHIVLLTDGDPEGYEYPYDIMDEITTRGITMTTILIAVTDETLKRNYAAHSTFFYDVDDSAEAIGTVFVEDVYNAILDSVGHYEYIKNLPIRGRTSLYLSKKATIEYTTDNGEELKIPAVNASHIISTRLIADDRPQIIYETTGRRGGLDYYKRLTLDGNTLTYDINGDKQYTKNIEPDILHWYVIFMLPDRLIVSKKVGDGLFPATDLLPSMDLVPRPLTYNNIAGEVII